MPDDANQPADTPKRPRTPRSPRRTGRKQTAQAILSPAPEQEAATFLDVQKTAGQPVTPTEASSQSQTSEPPVGEKWGEFPPVERRAKLKGMLEQWEQESNHGTLSSPFAYFRLTGADVYLLAALAVGAGDESAGKEALDEEKVLEIPNLHLEGAYLGTAHLEDAYLGAAHLEGADLHKAHLEGATLDAAHLESATLREARLEGATLIAARLERADLIAARLEGADLRAAHLEGADLREAHLINHVNLQEATCDAKTRLAETRLDATLRVADVALNGVPLVRMDWRQVPRLGDEAVARQAQMSGGVRKDAHYRLAEFEAAARAYRQLAIALRGQGITQAADRFTYRAQVMQRKALWLESGLPMLGFTESLDHLKTLIPPQFWQDAVKTGRSLGRWAWRERRQFTPRQGMRQVNLWARAQAHQGWAWLGTLRPGSWLIRFWKLPAWVFGLST